MKLSEAIQIGCKFRKQGFGHLLHNERTCALGAAYDGAAGRPLSKEEMFTWDHSGGFLDLFRPAIRAIQQTVRYDIQYWNDVDRFTREKIADMLEERGM